MAILKVARLGHPVLRQAARKITRKEIESAELRELIASMLETMFEYAGVGLAAPQVHFSLRLFVMQPDPQKEETLRVVINPTVTPLDGDETEEWEGCLSIPDMHGRVPRPGRVRLEATDAAGKAYSEELEGFAARVCQHEADHLDGRVFLDRMRDLSTLTFGEEFRRYWAAQEKEKEKDADA